MLCSDIILVSCLNVGCLCILYIIQFNRYSTRYCFIAWQSVSTGMRLHWILYVFGTRCALSVMKTNVVCSQCDKNISFIIYFGQLHLRQMTKSYWLQIKENKNIDLTLEHIVWKNMHESFTFWSRSLVFMKNVHTDFDSTKLPNFRNRLLPRPHRLILKVLTIISKVQTPHFHSKELFQISSHG